MRLICGVIPAICDFGINIGADEDMSLNDLDRVQVYMGHYPSGTSVKSLAHYGQIIASGEMKRFDYGETKNL